jgi:hypothetical protein
VIEKPQSMHFFLPASVIAVREEAGEDFSYTRAANGASCNDQHTGDNLEYASHQP